MVRLGTPYDFKALKSLWDESFDDDLNYIDFIFDKVSLPSDAMIYDVAGEVAAMLLMIPTRFIYRSEVVNTLYILGACTKKKFRGKGLMTELLAQAEERASTSGAALSILVPGDKYLFDYYRDRGYSADFRVRHIQLKKGAFSAASSADAPIVIDRVSPSDIYELRSNALKDVPHVAWSRKQMPFVLEDTLIYGGHAAVYEGTLGKAYAFYNTDRKKLFIKECLGTSVDAQMALMKSIAEKQNPKQVQINVPVDSPLFPQMGQVIPYGMAKSLNSGRSFRDLDPYMSLMLD